MQGSHCHHTIKQSSASPNSLQLSSAGTRHSHYNKHSPPNVVLTPRHAYTDTMHTDIKKIIIILCLIGRPDSWKMKVGRRGAQDGTTRERSALVGVALAAATAASPEDYWGEEGREHYA